MRKLAFLRRRPDRIRTLGEREPHYALSTILINLSPASRVRFDEAVAQLKALLSELHISSEKLWDIRVKLDNVLSDVERTWSFHHGVNCGDETFTPRATEALVAMERLYVACKLLLRVLDNQVAYSSDYDVELPWRTAAFKQTAVEFLFVRTAAQEELYL
jgi:hypothetical protein